MNNTQIRDSLIVQAEAAFLVLVRHLDVLFDAAAFYGDRYPPDTASQTLKAAQLNVAIKDLGTIPQAIAAEIGRWKKEEERVLSRLGVEIQLLNELYFTMEATMLFFIREGIDLEHFSLAGVRAAHYELLRCNRLL